MFAVAVAAAVARVGKFLGYHVVVCDARPVFATSKRFPDADEVVVKWPHDYLSHAAVDERTVICVLTHDPKFDVPLLQAALPLDVAYVGAMGSRRTHEDRLDRLREAGVPVRTLLLGGVLGIVGFFVVPVVGLLLGFVLGVYLAELGRLGRARAWPSARHALTAVGWSILIELAAGLLAAAVWVGALVLA